MENPQFVSEMYLHSGSIFQPAMLDYRRVASFVGFRSSWFFPEGQGTKANQKTERKIFGSSPIACPKFAVEKNPTNQGVLQGSGEEFAKTKSCLYLLIIWHGGFLVGDPKIKQKSRRDCKLVMRSHL